LAPRLSDSARLHYLFEEIEFIEEILDDVTDCKWIYQALVGCKMLIAKIQGYLSEKDQGQVKAWLQELKTLDQLRIGRWIDLEQKLDLQNSTMIMVIDSKQKSM
jgi:geranylgeranyl transferase type-2 subunit alpha